MLAFDFEWKAREETQGISRGHPITVRRVTSHCALAAGSVVSWSLLDGPDDEQSAAMTELESEMRAEIPAIPDDSVAAMRAMAAQMADGRARGRSDQECALVMVGAMQANATRCAARERHRARRHWTASMPSQCRSIRSASSATRPARSEPSCIHGSGWRSIDGVALRAGPLSEHSIL